MRCRRRLLRGLVAAVCVAFVAVAATARGSPRAQWTMSDLGTLGGPGSHAVAINERGQIVGRADTAAEHSHAFLWEHGRMRDLGSLGGPDSSAAAINNRGQVVGWAETAGRDGYDRAVRHAFLWQNGRMRDLGTLGGKWSAAYAINDRGQVVGEADTAAKDADGMAIWHAFLWQDGKMHDLGTLGGPLSEATAINNIGEIAGTSDTKTDFLIGFVWSNGRMRSLGDFSLGRYRYSLGEVTPGNPRPLNASGQIAGKTRGRPGRPGHAGIWQNGSVRDLGSLAGAKGESWAASITDGGLVIGNSVTHRGRGHAFLWRKGRMLDLTPGAFASGAVAANDRGQVIAWVRHRSVWAKNYAIIWQDGQATELTGRGTWGTTVAAINGRSQIIGRTGDNSAVAHAVLWQFGR